MAHAKFEGVIFDMDGTLLDTLPDLVVVTNHALAQEGFPSRTQSEVLSYVGNGGLSLVRQACGEGATEEQIARVFATFRGAYAEVGMDLTKEFEGMTSTLQALRDAGIKTGIMSNKFEVGVLDVQQRFMPGLFDSVHGESDIIPRKPEPEGLWLCAKEMGVDPSRCAYVGDSASDVRAARNAGMFAVAAAWGYQPREDLEAEAPDAMIGCPQELLAVAGL